MAISLEKGQRISLKKESDNTLSKVFMGLGWDVAKPKGFFSSFKKVANIDLDASCLLFDANKCLVDAVWFKQLRSKDGSISHSGDNLTGAGDGDDETISVDLDRIPQDVTTLIFTINSFRGQTFDEIDNAFCRLVDCRTNAEIASYRLSGGGNFTAQIMAKIYRYQGEWKMAAIGEPANGQTFQDMMPEIVGFI